jgi:hypothetical protein
MGLWQSIVLTGHSSACVTLLFRLDIFKLRRSKSTKPVIAKLTTSFTVAKWPTPFRRSHYATIVPIEQYMLQHFDFEGTIRAYC